jgi:molybdate transport system regulatory protein
MPPQRPAPEIRFRIRINKGKTIAIGPGKIDLLEAIDEARSLTAAAKTLGMSYRRAWLLLDTMNRCFREPVVQTSAGGAHGGGTRVTPLGREVIDRYRRAEAAAARAGGKDLEALAALLR